MADLELKDIWAKGKSQQLEPIQIDVDNVVGKKSKTVLYWVKFILWIEFWLNVACIPYSFYAIYQEGFTWTYIIAFFIISIYLAYYLFLIRNINRFDYSGDVKNSLKKIYKYLRYYVLHYKVIVWTLFPMAFLYGGYVGASQALSEAGKELVIWSEKFFVIFGIMSVLALIFSLVFYFLVNLIYGRKIKRLKKMIDELEE